MKRWLTSYFNMLWILLTIVLFWCVWDQKTELDNIYGRHNILLWGKCNNT